MKRLWTTQFWAAVLGPDAPASVRVVVACSLSGGVLFGIGSVVWLLLAFVKLASMRVWDAVPILITAAVGLTGLAGGLLVRHRSRMGLRLAWIYALGWVVVSAAGLAGLLCLPGRKAFWGFPLAGMPLVVALLAAMLLRSTRAHFDGARDWFLEWGRTPNEKYKVGTLKYTGFGLLMVFIWLLWGDFVFMMLDNAVPGILPVKLKDLGAGDQTIAALTKVFAYATAFLFSPWVSTKSDRTRSSWGRRMPYLLWSTPFVGLFLAGVGCYEPLARLFTGGADHARILGMTVSAKTLSLVVLAVMIICWDLANVFVSAIYWYLFNDVVPSAYLSRFLAFFRIVLSIAYMVYNRWVFEHSRSHFQMVFVIAGIAYVAGFMLMVFFVREGEYPPPAPMAEHTSGWVERWRESIRTYARECFSHRMYWYFYLANMCTFMCSLAAAMYSTIRNLDVLKISMADLGYMGVWTTLIGMLIQYPAGWVADRWHPIRVYVLSHIWYMLGTIAQCAWMVVDFNRYHPRGNLLYMWVISLVFMPLNAIANASELPMYMRILPKDRYGQFCSANSAFRSFAMIFGSFAAGALMSRLAPWQGEWRYTWVSAWTLVWQAPGAVFLVLMYRQWKKLGGNTSYTPPIAAKDIALPPLLPVLGLLVGFTMGFAGLAGWVTHKWRLNAILPTFGWLSFVAAMIWLVIWKYTRTPLPPLATGAEKETIRD